MASVGSMAKAKAPLVFDIVKRSDGYHVVSKDHANHLGGPYDTRGEAEKRLAQVEAHKKTFSRQGQAIKFEGTVLDGKVRTGVWDLVCVPGRNVKDDEETVFNEQTLMEMINNFAARGDLLMIDWNHQSSYAHENGQPAPALGFYGALALVMDGGLVGCEYAKGVAQTPPNAAEMEGGLWALRSEVTPCGQELLPGFKYLSPTFTPAGTDQVGNSIGYCLLAVAATNTPWQAGTQITFDRGVTMAQAVDASGQSVQVGDRVRWKPTGATGRVVRVTGDGTVTIDPDQGDDGEVTYVPSSPRSFYKFQRNVQTKTTVTKEGRELMRLEKTSSPITGAKTMKNLTAAAKLVGLESSADAKAIQSAFVQKYEDEAAKAAMEEAYAYDDSADRLEEMAKAYEDAEFEEEEDGEAPHVIMRKMAAKFRRLGKMGDPPFGGKETPSEEAAEEAAKKKMDDAVGATMEDDKEKEKMEDDEEDKKAMHAMAAKLGLPKTASARQISLAMDARTVGLDQFGHLEKRLAEMENQRKAELQTERKRAALITFEQAIARGRTKEEKKAVFIASYERDPKDAEGLLFADGTFPARDVLFSRMTAGGAPHGVDARGGVSHLDQKVVTMSALGTNAKALVFGENLSQRVIEIAESDDPKTRSKIDRDLPEGTKGTKYENFERYLAAERMLKKDRPDLFDAAREDLI